MQQNNLPTQLANHAKISRKCKRNTRDFGHKNSKVVQLWTGHATWQFWQHILDALDTNWAYISLRCNNMTIQEGLYARISIECRLISSKSEGKDSVSQQLRAVLLGNNISRLDHWNTCYCYWEDILDNWNGKSIEMVSRDHKMELHINAIRAVLNMQGIGGYICNQRSWTVIFQWLVFIIHFLSLFIMQFVIPVTSSQLNTGNRIHVIVKFYFFHHLRSLDNIF